MAFFKHLYFHRYPESAPDPIFMIPVNKYLCWLHLVPKVQKFLPKFLHPVFKKLTLKDLERNIWLNTGPLRNNNFRFGVQIVLDITTLQPLVDNSLRPTKGIRIITFKIIEVRNILFDSHLTDFGNYKIH